MEAMHCSTLTKRGQTTVPKEVRERLQLESGQRVAYRVEGDRVYLEAQPRGAGGLRGALAAPGGGEPPEDAARAREAARKARVGRYV